MYGCESGTIKKAEHWRIDAFYLWCWRRLLRVPWTAGKSSQSILNNPKGNQDFLIIHWNLNIHWKDWCWSWSSKTEHQIRRTNSLEKTPMLGKIEGRRRRGLQRRRWLDGITDLMDMSLSKLRVLQWTGKPIVLQSMWLKSLTWPNYFNELNWSENQRL